jgi:hypothetical protein
MANVATLHFGAGAHDAAPLRHRGRMELEPVANCRTGSNEPRFSGSGYRAAGAGQLAFLKTSFETSRGIRTEVDGRAWTRLILLI